ncbi:MAG: TolC family protein [Nitrospiraceae bacterium]
MKIMSIVAIVLASLLALGITEAEYACAAEPPPHPAQGAPELALSLHDAIEAALDQNPKVRLFKERIEAARGVERTQLGALLPNLAGSVNYYNMNFFLGKIGGSPVTTPSFDIFDARGNFTQSLFSWSLIQKWRASREGFRVAEFESEATKRDTTATVALLYTDVLRGQATAKLRQANVELYRQLLTLTQDRQAGGKATGLDTARAEGLLEHERQRLLSAEMERERAKLNLIRGLGISFEVRLTLLDDLYQDQEPVPDPQQAMAEARAHRVELQAQLQRMKLASLTLSSVTSERLPSLAAQGDLGLIGNTAPQSITTYNVGLVLSVPIFDGGQREGRIRESRSLMRQEEIRLNDVTSQIALEVRDALVTLGSTRDQILVANQCLIAALKEMELALERFTLLAASNIELTNAQASLGRAQDNWLDAIYKYNAARVNLARAVGRLDTL